MIGLEELEKMWLEDQDIDQNNLAEASRDTPKLHAKYWPILMRQVMKRQRLEAELKELELAKYQYYRGQMDIEEIKQRGWEPLQLKIIATEVGRYVEADKDVIKLSLQIGYIREVCSFIEDIIRTINYRNAHIKNMIDYARFRSGG